MPRRFCKRARPRATRPRIAPPLPPVRAPSGRAAALPSPHPVRASLPPLPPARAPSGRAAALPSPHPVRTPPRRCRPSPPLPSVRAPPVRAAPRRCRPSVPHPDAPQHCHLHIPSAHRCRRCRSTAIPTRRHGRSTLCFCALANYHSAVLTNTRPPCYAEASAGRGRSAPPRRPAAGNEPGRTLRNPRALPQGTNRGADAPANPAPAAGNEPGADAPANPAPAAPRSPRGAPEGNGPPPCRGKRTGGGRSRTPRRPAAGNEPGRDVPANPAPAVPCSPRGAPEGNGSPPKTNGLRARHRAAGGKEAACSASSCPRCARWRR